MVEAVAVSPPSRALTGVGAKAVAGAAVGARRVPSRAWTVRRMRTASWMCSISSEA